MDDEDVTLNEDDVEEMVEIVEVDDDEFETEDGMDEETIDDNSSCVFTKHSKSVFCGTFSKDAKLAATGGEDDKAYVWDTSTGNVILECSYNESVVFVDFNHNSTLIATGDLSGVIQVWDLKNKAMIWDTQIGEITWMQWHQVANVLFATSTDGEIYMWKIPDGECKALQSLQQRIDSAVLFPDGKRLAVGYESGTLRIVDLKTSSVLHTISSDVGHTSTITAMDCHPSNNLIISASVDGTTILTTSQTGKVVSVLQKLEQKTAEEINESGMEYDSENNFVETVKFHNDPQKFIAATGTRFGEIFVWDIAKQMLRNKIVPTNGITKLLWKENTTLIFAAGMDGAVSCCDGWSGEQVKFYTGHSGTILDLCITRDGKQMLTVSDDSTARIFEIEDH